MEKILDIKEVGFIHPTEGRTRFEGFEIQTDQQSIKVGIDSDGQCCERFGYLHSEDDIKIFIGAELYDIVLVDKALNSKKMDELDLSDPQERRGRFSTMFVNFNTSKGLFQIVAYNDHNGYYGHDAVLLSRQLTTSTTL